MRELVRLHNYMTYKQRALQDLPGSQDIQSALAAHLPDKSGPLVSFSKIGKLFAGLLLAGKLHSLAGIRED